MTESTDCPAPVIQQPATFAGSPWLAAMRGYTSTHLDAEQWAAWSVPVRDLVSACFSEAEAHMAAGALSECIALADPAPGTPLPSVLSDAHVRRVVTAMRGRGRSQYSQRNAAAVLHRMQRHVRGVPNRDRTQPVTDRGGNVGGGIDMLQGLLGHPDVSAEVHDTLLVILQDLHEPKHSPWARPVSSAAFTAVKQAVATITGKSLPAWPELRQEALVRAMGQPEPAFKVLQRLALNRNTLDALAKKAPDVRDAGPALRGSATLLSILPDIDEDTALTHADTPAAHMPEAATPDAASDASPAASSRRQRRGSRAAARRATDAYLLAQQAPTPPLSPVLEEWLATWSPVSMPVQGWELVRDLTHDLLRRSGIKGADSIKKNARALAWFLHHRAESGYELSAAEAMTGAAIDEYIRCGVRSSRNSSSATVRALLRNLAAAVQASDYTPDDLARIVRLTDLPADPAMRRRLKTALALGAGAGLDLRDIRTMTRTHVEDRDQEGILLSVEGDRPREVWLRAAFEDLLREGISHLTARECVLGRNSLHKGSIVSLYESIQPVGGDLRIQQGRLRNTWLVTLMCEPIPLWTILRAAGLESPRTLADLTQHLIRDADQDGDGNLLRGAA